MTFGGPKWPMANGISDKNKEWSGADKAAPIPGFYLYNLTREHKQKKTFLKRKIKIYGKL